MYILCLSDKLDESSWVEKLEFATELLIDTHGLCTLEVSVSMPVVCASMFPVQSTVISESKWAKALCGKNLLDQGKTNL